MASSGPALHVWFIIYCWVSLQDIWLLMEFICNVVWFSVYQADSCWVCFVYQLVLCYNCAPVGSMLQLCISWFCYNSASVGSMLQLCMKLCFMYKQYNSGGPRQFQCNPSFFGNPGLSTHTIGAISISRSIEGTSLGLWSEVTIVRISQTLQRLLLPSARGDWNMAGISQR